MMRARVLVGLIGAPIGICVLWMGGAPLALVAAIIAAIGGVEYARMCRTKAWTPSQPLISVGSALFVVDAVANNGAYCGPLLPLEGRSWGLRPQAPWLCRPSKCSELSIAGGP
jgi:hypothetical protein